MAQNLITNPSNESALVAGNIYGWTQVFGQWGQRNANPAPHDGNSYFFAGASANAELFQDVNVGKFASAIDAHRQDFVFEGWVRSYDQPNPDSSHIIVEFRNAQGEVLGILYDSGERWSTSHWELTASGAQRAPNGTRRIRVRLISTRYNGNNNDGYYDKLSLTASETSPFPHKWGN